MADITKIIQQYLIDHPNIMANTIASAISKSRSEVNSCLYAQKGKLFEVNDNYQWRLKSKSNRSTDTIIDVPESIHYLQKKTNQNENIIPVSKRYFIVFEGTHYRFVISDIIPPISERGYSAEIFDIDEPQFILYELKYKKGGLNSIIHIIPLLDNFEEIKVNEIHDIPTYCKEQSHGHVTNAITAL